MEIYLLLIILLNTPIKNSISLISLLEIFLANLFDITLNLFLSSFEITFSKPDILYKLFSNLK